MKSEDGATSFVDSIVKRWPVRCRRKKTNFMCAYAEEKINQLANVQYVLYSLCWLEREIILNFERGR